jgi:aldehyde dehydrogenase
MAADIPLALTILRYFAGVIRAEESSIAELDSQTVIIA